MQRKVTLVSKKSAKSPILKGQLCGRENWPRGECNEAAPPSGRNLASNKSANSFGRHCIRIVMSAYGNNYTSITLFDSKNL